MGKKRRKDCRKGWFVGFGWVDRWSLGRDGNNGVMSPMRCRPQGDHHADFLSFCCTHNNTPFIAKPDEWNDVYRVGRCSDEVSTCSSEGGALPFQFQIAKFHILVIDQVCLDMHTTILDSVHTTTYKCNASRLVFLVMCV